MVHSASVQTTTKGPNQQIEIFAAKSLDGAQESY
jgi:hypothetical protein